MTRQVFEIDWKDSKANIEFDDDLPHGEFKEIRKKVVNLEDIIAGKLKIDIDLYIDLILQKTIKSAPFNPNQDELNTMGESIHTVIADRIMASFPLEKSLGSWIIAMLGNSEESISMIKSMPSVLSSSVGINSQ